MGGVLTSIWVLSPRDRPGTSVFPLRELLYLPLLASESSYGETAHTDQMDPVTKVKQWGIVILVCVHAQAHRIPQFASVYETRGGLRASALFPVVHWDYRHMAPTPGFPWVLGTQT